MARQSIALLPPDDMRKVASAAGCESRTVARYFAGGNTLPAVRAAIEKALRDGGCGHLVRMRTEGQAS